MPHPLPLTGERTLPGVEEEAYWFARHAAAYAWLATGLAERIRGGRVLEAGCGEGYGAALLADAGARVVLGVDYDEQTCRHVRTAYPQVTPLRANLAALPCAAGTVDLVVCLQVVEHLWDLRAFLRACAATLAPGGLLVVSTPNRPVQSPGLGRGERPLNPFHVEEFDADQVRDLLTGAGLDQARVLGLHHGPRLAAWEAAHGSLPAALVAGVLAGRTDPQAAALAATVSAADFEVRADASGAFDLIGIAGRAA